MVTPKKKSESVDGRVVGGRLRPQHKVGRNGTFRHGLDQGKAEAQAPGVAAAYHGRPGALNPVAPAPCRRCAKGFAAIEAVVSQVLQQP